MIPETKHISSEMKLYVYDLKELCSNTIKLIDDNLVQICEGDSDTSLEQAKLTFLDFLSNKDETTKIGARKDGTPTTFLKSVADV